MLIVIGGDSYYQNEDEEARSVISRWAKRKVASQFREEYLDGRQSFIFSWNKKHRPIHEQAMRHFLDPSKRGFKFEYTPPAPRPLPKPIAPVVPQPSRKPEAPEVPQPATPYWRREVEFTVTANNNSPIQDYAHRNDQTQPTFEMTSGFKPFT